MKSDDTVADLGAGVGYFTIPIAKHSDHVVAVDIEPKMLEMLKENANHEQITNIEYRVSDLEHIQLEDNTVDKIIVAFVLHEVPNLDQALNEIKRILKPGGKGLILEWEAVEMEAGPPLHERIPSGDFFEILKKHGMNPYQDFILLNINKPDRH